MKAVKAIFDGERIVLPQEANSEKPGEVLIIFPETIEADDDFWLRVKNESLKKVWDNDEDAIYDSL